MKIKLTKIRYLIGKRILLTIMRTFMFLLCTTVFSLTTENSFSQVKISIDGIVTDEAGVPLPGASIKEQYTSNGTITDFDGTFTIQVKSNQSVLVVSYIGYATREILIGDQTNIKIVLKESNAQLGEVVVTGIRASETRAIIAKRNATTVVEAITPEDIGNFSDENIADALQRVPGVQVQRNDDGTSGDRVSLRGIGSQFVIVTINGRTPVSSGSEGTSAFREFNLGVLPPDILGGALIYKASESNLIETGIGGAVDFQTIRPLDTKYKNDRNFFLSVTTRGQLSESSIDNNIRPRISAIFGAKTKNEKLGAYVSFITSDLKNARDAQLIRTSLRTIRVDNDGNGVFDPNVDSEIEKIRVPRSVTLNPIRENRKRFGLASAVQWKPTNNIEVIADVFKVKYDNNSTRDLSRVIFVQGGGQSLYNRNSVWSPDSFIIENDYLQYLEVGGASRSSVRNQLQSIQFDNQTDNTIGGLNFKWKTGSWKVNADISISKLDYTQELATSANRRANLLDQSPIIWDARGRTVNLTVGDDVFDPSSYTFLGNVKQFRNVSANNEAYKIDLNKKFNDKYSLDFGGRYNSIFLDRRQASLSTGAPTAEQLANINLNDELSDTFLPDHNIGYNSWLQATNLASFRAQFPNLYGATVGSSFDGDLFDAEDGDIPLDRGKSFSIEENSLALYSKLNFKWDIGIPVSGNFGVRAVRTSIEGKAFTALTLKDPLQQIPNVFDAFVEAKTTSDRWDVLPSLNLKLEFNKNFTYRFSVSKVISRPNLDHLVPRNSVSTTNPDSAVLDPDSPDYNPDRENRERGNINSGNPDLNPYSTWQIDNTIEIYPNWGGALVISGFYKDISDFIISTRLVDQEAPDNLGITISDNPDAVLYNITKPVNFSDADVYGFEVGFNQPFTFLPSPFDGFGAKANYTYIKSSFKEDVGDAGEGFPGSSTNNFNGLLYYDKYGIGIRLAYTYRDDYLRNLSGGNDVRANTTFTEGGGQLNLRASYKITKALQASVSIANLTENDRRDYIGSKTNPFQFVSRERVWTFGLRYKL